MEPAERIGVGTCAVSETRRWGSRENLVERTGISIVSETLCGME